jgi:hypothetical protein
MATLTFTDKQKNGLIKKFHTLLGRAGVNKSGKEAILWRCGVEHTNDLSITQLIEECDALEKEMNPQLKELDRWRKKLIACISDYHRAMAVDIFQKEYKYCTPDEKERRSNYAKGTASNAAEGKEFNQISLKQLHSLYNAFLKSKKDLERVEKLTAENMLYTVSLN